MRTLALVSLLTLAACAVNAPVATAPPPARIYGFTLDEEAAILALEDRREFDAELAKVWAGHENSLHRSRIALALGRIGPSTFVDANGNREKDPGERQAGLDLLTGLLSDRDSKVRETAAFALGEIGDKAGVDALFRSALDTDAVVAAEATEALSKLAADVPLPRYAELTRGERLDAVRIRAVRFLFRFNTDEASAVAASLLDSPNLELREAAVYALARRAYAPARGPVELLLTDPSYAVRAYAASALGRIASGESTGALINALNDAHPWVRTNALIALNRIATKDLEAIVRPQLPEDALRVVDMTEDPDPGTRASAIDTLGWYARKSEIARRRLADLVTSGSRWGRELAVGAWTRAFGPGSKPQTNWEKVRSIEGKLDPSFSSDPDPMVRAAVLANIPDDQVKAHADLIRRAMSDPDVVVRANAIDRYARLERPDVTLLRERERLERDDAMNDARLGAIGAISEIEHPERESFLRSLVTDRDPVVRRIAAEAIEQKLKKPRPQYTPLPVTRSGDDYRRIVEWARGRHEATIRTARGDIRVLLLTPDAPMTTWNFAELARKGYFNGTSFMRVVPNFVIQGGDPRNDMSGGPGYAIRDEINLQKYVRGAVGMALSGPDTGGSQFFITHSPQPHLDGGYTIFGRVVEGLAAVVDQMERGDRVETILVDGAARQ